MFTDTKPVPGYWRVYPDAAISAALELLTITVTSVATVRSTIDTKFKRFVDLMISEFALSVGAIDI